MCPAVVKHNNNLPLVIFSHIEKTGGTSLNGVLRTYHGINYAHVRSLKHEAPPSHRAVHMDDLFLYKKLVPWVKCVSGHAVRPWVMIDEGLENGLFMTVLREPLARYVSYYTYGGGVKRKPWGFSFEEYLEYDEFHNFQTKRLAGVADASKAISIIEKYFLAASVLESMDELLSHLDRVWPGFEKCASIVGRRNVRSDPDRNILLERYKEEIIKNNEEDLKLYQFLQDRYNGLFLNNDVINNAAVLLSHTIDKKPMEIYSALLNRLYLSPITGVIRKINGLPYKGTY